MVSVCPLLLLPPPQPAAAVARIARSSRPAQAYPWRLATGKRFRVNRNIIKSKHIRIHIGSAGMRGIRRGSNVGGTKERVVVSVAVQNAAAVLEAAVGVHVAAADSELEPFLNCTVPVGPTPLLFVATVALSVMLPPEVMLVTLGTTWVAVAACVTVRLTAIGPA